MNTRGQEEYQENEIPFAFNPVQRAGPHHQQYENESERPFAFNTSPPGGHRQYGENDKPFAFAFNTERTGGHHHHHEHERPVLPFNTSPGANRLYSENEDPYTLKPERTGGGRTHAGRTDSYNFDQDTTVNVPAGREGSFERNASMDKRLNRLRVWNTGLRFATFVLCVAAVIFIASSRQTSKKVDGRDGTPSKATYHFSGSFVFFLWVNVTVAAYALVLSVCAFVVGGKGESQTTPISMMWPALILNVVHATFLILAFAVALSVDVVSRNGLSLGSVIWEPICHYYNTFCTLNEIALGASVAAYLCLLAGTCIDAYCIHVFT